MTETALERRILERRARELARPTREQSRTGDRDVVLFTAADATYGIELSCLRHVFALRELALLPGAEPPLIGVTGWRGELIRILDLAAILELPGRGRGEQAFVLVLGAISRSFGLLADAILDITAEPETLAVATENRFLRGVTADAVALLDGGQLIRTFTGEEL